MLIDVQGCSRYFFEILLQHRSLEHELKQIRILEDEVMEGTKGSRLSKWISSTKQKPEFADVADPDKLQILAELYIYIYIFFFALPPRSS